MWCYLESSVETFSVLPMHLVFANKNFSFGD